MFKDHLYNPISSFDNLSPGVILTLCGTSFVIGGLSTFFFFRCRQESKSRSVSAAATGATSSGDEGFHFKGLSWDKWIEPCSEDRPQQIFQIRWNASPYGEGTLEHTQPQLELSPEEAEGLLVKNERSIPVRRQGNSLVRVDVNELGGNAVSEDELVLDILDKDDLNKLQEKQHSFWATWAQIQHTIWPSFTPVPGNKAPLSAPLSGDGSKDIVFASVFDGHSGGCVSALLKRVMHASLAHSLGKLKEDGWNSRAVQETVIKTFKALDDSITNTPLDLAKKICDSGSHSHNGNSGEDLLPSPQPVQLALSDLLRAGACALTAIFNAEDRSIYVAGTGDCRAVAGWYRPLQSHSGGQWRCDTLTEDCEGSNPHEGTRVRAEHPDDDSNDIIRDEGATARLLGYQPTRTFGDLVTKVEKDQYEQTCGILQIAPARLSSSSDPSKEIPRPSPPYITAEPQVVVRKLGIAAGVKNEQLRFVILATDGLWDLMSSEEAVLLVAAHLSHPQHGPVAKTDLPGQYPHEQARATRPHPAEALPGTVEANSQGFWTFEDDNAATHLIRNALPGDGDQGIRRKVLSLKGRGARAVRDDMAVIVLFFDDDQAISDI